MRNKWIGVLAASTFAAMPLLAQSPPAPVPYEPPPPGPSSYQAPPSPAPYQAPPSPASYQAPPSPASYQAPPAPPSFPGAENIGPPSGSTVPVPPSYLAPAPPPLVMFPPPNSEPYRIWVRAELLLWWIKDAPLPAPIALVTDSSGNSSTVIGNSNSSFGAFSGVRVALGAWFDANDTIGFETSFFGLDRRTNNQSVSSDGNGNPSIGLSFLNATPGSSGEFIQTLSAPGAFAGNIQVSSTLELWGIELNGALNLVRSGGFELTALAGFRYFDLQESLSITGNSTDIATGNFLSLYDQFSTRNQFYGGQVGARLDWQANRWTVEATGKVALGVTHETVDIGGNTFASPGGFSPGGFYTQPSNIGHYTANQFGVIPSLELKVGYQLNRAWRVFIGYDFMYWNQVVRPGNQIDRNINLNQSAILSPTGATTGPASPTPLFNRSDFWAQGMTLGFEFRF